MSFTTLRLLPFTLIKFAIHRSIFPKRSGRSHWCLYRHQLGMRGMVYQFYIGQFQFTNDEILLPASDYIRTCLWSQSSRENFYVSVNSIVDNDVPFLADLAAVFKRGIILFCVHWIWIRPNAGNQSIEVFPNTIWQAVKFSRLPNGMHGWFCCLSFGVNCLLWLHMYCSGIYTSLHMQWTQFRFVYKINHGCHLAAC